MINKKKLIITYIILSLLLAAVFVLGISVGSVSLSIKEITEGIKGNNVAAEVIIKNLRLPRVLASMLAGAALACAGAVLQCVTGNNICAPNIVGVNSGAGFAVILTLSIFPSMWALLPFSAFIGALFATFIVMAISFSGAGRTSGSMIVLAGVAVSSVLSAGISFLSILFPDIIVSYTAFSIGGFSGVNMRDIIIPSAIIIPILILLQLISPRLNLLCLGDEYAVSLGVRVKALKLTALICTAALCACAVSFAGLLGFVGLIVPNIIKRICGNDMRFNIPLCALFGAVLLSFSDILSRTLFAPSEIPCGIIMSFIGAPFFIYLLLIRRYRYA